MAENPAQSKTEEPTTRRRDESRQEGQVAFSQELNAGILLLAGSILLTLMGGGFGETIKGFLNHYLRMDFSSFGQSELRHLFTIFAVTLFNLLFVFVGILFLIGVLISVVQVGFTISSSALLPKWNRLSPLQGLQRLFSVQGLFRGVIAIVKIGVIVGVVSWILKGKIAAVGSLSGHSLAFGISMTWQLATQVFLAISIALVFVGLADFVYQRFRHGQQLRMTRQELQEEMKRDEGDPMLRGRRRAVARQIASSRQMVEKVKDASVVITNPTHIAVAIRYEHGITEAPQVIAKGRGLIAEEIMRRARRIGIPTIQNRPVARVLFRTVRIGDVIPVSLYKAVSQVLAFVYRLRGQAA